MTRRGAPLRLAAVTAVAVLAAAALVSAFEPFADAYLVAAMFWLNFALGGLALAVMHALTGGRWGAWARPAAGLLMRSLAPLALAMLPLALGYQRLLPGRGTELARSQRAWFAAPWFEARLALYFAIWIALALALRRVGAARRARVAALAAVLYTLTASSFCVDWLASSTPGAMGTIVGFVLVGSQLTAGFAFALVLAALRERAAPGPAADRRQDLANLLLAAVVFYGYVLVMQLLIVWSPNLPREIEWYLARGNGVGVAALAGLVACHGVAIVLLCSRRLKRDRAAMLCVGGLVLLGHLFDTYWWLAPLLRASAARLLDLALIALLGLALSVVLRPPVPLPQIAGARR